MKKHKWQAHEIGLIIAGLVILLVMFGVKEAMGATWPISAHIPSTVDKVWFVKYVDGVATDSAMWTQRYIDTTITVNETSSYMVALQIYYAGEDSSSTWAWVWPANIKDGSGSNAVVIYAVTATDNISGMNVTVRTAGGTIQGRTQVTNSVGNTTFNLDTGTYHITVTGTSYSFDVDTVSVTGADTFSVLGTATTITAPTDASLVTVSGNVTRISGITGTNVYGVNISAYHNVSGNKHSVDTIGGAKIIMPLEAFADTDSTGAFSLYLRKSSNYTDTTQGFYTIIGKFKSREIFKIERMYITGDIDIGDTLAVRGQ